MFLLMTNHSLEGFNLSNIIFQPHRERHDSFLAPTLDLVTLFFLTHLFAKN